MKITRLVLLTISSCISVKLASLKNTILLNIEDDCTCIKNTLKYFMLSTINIAFDVERYYSF